MELFRALLMSKLVKVNLRWFVHQHLISSACFGTVKRLISKVTELW
jgi:hypothetical protein